jgi:hypothetical protein
MTGGQLIAVAAIVVPSATALLVAYWHRKQMRQIEAFRQNPALGLHPPDSKVYTFLKAKRILLVGVGLPATSLTLEMLRSGPVTRFSVLVVSVSVSSMLFAMLLWLFDRVLGIIEGMTSILDSYGTTFKKSLKVTEGIAKIVKKQGDA